MQSLSYGASCGAQESFTVDFVSLVERIHCPEGIDVYDIEVEKAHNFFANDILVHNCGIIDDPVKGREDADILFMPVLRWLEEEPALLLRMEHLLAALRFARERGRPEQARVYAQAANALLTVLRGQLSPADQEALQIHGRTAEISEGLELE